MFKKIIILNVFIIITLLLSGCGNKHTQTPENIENNSVEFNRTSLTVEVPQESQETKEPIETELGTFSTTIKSKGAGRLNNIRITCSKINGQIVESGSEFSFDKIVGKSSPDEGYQKADIFVDKKIVQAYGGGNCQVSTTLYNAILTVSGLTVTERHPHGRKVDYVPEGKDAAVSHGTLDLKFRNDTGVKIKIYASSDDSTLTIRIMKVE